MHFAFAATDDPQLLLVITKSAFVVVTELMVRAEAVPFVRVTFFVPLVVPITWLPKLRMTGDTVTRALDICAVAHIRNKTAADNNTLVGR